MVWRPKNFPKLLWHYLEFLAKEKLFLLTLSLPENNNKKLNLQQNKKSFLDLVSFLFPSHTNLIIFNVYFSALHFFFCCKGLEVLEADFPQIRQIFEWILVHFAELFPLLSCVCCCGRCNKRKKWRIHCWECWNPLEQGMKSWSGALDGFSCSESC